MLVSKTLPQDVVFLVFVLHSAASLAMLSAGSSVLAYSAGKIRTKEFGSNLCDEASAAMQEQMFYATFIPIN